MAESHGARVVKVESSSAFLPLESPVRRLPRAPNRRRPPGFWQAFEDRALFYDCFRSMDGSILLSCPPPCNLMPLWRAACFVAQPSGRMLEPRFFLSRSTMTIALPDAPADTRFLTVRFAETTFEVPVQPSLAEIFAGRRVMFTMNKDNDLDWIRLWADWHARLHGVDAIILFDNGSSRYDTDALERTLAEVNNIERIAVLSWPHRYGPVDPAVLLHPYWPNFLQVASFRVTIARLAPAAAGVLNCDIDELVGVGERGNAFRTLLDSPNGLVKLKGTWVEAVIAPQDSAHRFHLLHRYRLKNRLRSICADKWIIDPKAGWARDLSFTPMMHRIYGLSGAINRRAPKLPFFHFKAINTNWKEERAAASTSDARGLVRLRELDEAVARYHTLR